MNNGIIKIVLITVMAFTIYSCTTINHTMREPKTLVNLNKSDFTLSEQLSAEANTTIILGIDFGRLFTKKSGVINNGANNISFASIPVIGNAIGDKTSNYALYNLMIANPGYDVVFYPQFETTVFRPAIIGIIAKTIKVKTTARLGKLNK